MILLRGCGTAIVTPFLDSGEVDWDALRAFVAWQVEEGIDFIVACGTTGETPTLTDDERVQVVATAREAAAGRIPIMAGATSNDTRRAVDEARRMCDAGADLILTASPYYNRPTQEGLRRHFSAVADASSKPVVLYNVPGRAGVNLLPATAIALAGHGNITGIKEAAGDMHQALELLRLRPTGFRVYSGDDWMALPLCAAGGDGLISVASNELPRAMTELVRHALVGELEEARTLQGKLQPLMDANFIESNPIPVKAALSLMGHMRNVLRLPLLPAQPSTVARLRDELARLDLRLHD
jgi:4-hydroxy-tetrahydrodipicolinate synthase